MKIAITTILLALFYINSSTKSENAFYDYYEGIENAKKSNKPILLIFTGQTCENPIETNELIENDKEIKLKISDSFQSIILYVDDKTKLLEEKKVVRDGKTVKLRTKGNEWAHIEMSKYKNNVQPLMVIINSNEEILKQPLIGKITKDDILEYLKF